VRAKCYSIDARKMGRMISRVQRELEVEDIARIAETVAAWRGEVEDGATITEYQDFPASAVACRWPRLPSMGMCYAGRYVGAEVVEDDDEAFAEKNAETHGKAGRADGEGCGT